jgi:hypothetical protein
MESGDFFSSSVLPWRAGRTYGFFSHGFPASRGSVGRDGADLFFCYPASSRFCHQDCQRGFVITVFSIAGFFSCRGRRTTYQSDSNLIVKI